jgi:hypothetical protein
MVAVNGADYDLIRTAEYFLVEPTLREHVKG